MTMEEYRSVFLHTIEDILHVLLVDGLLVLKTTFVILNVIDAKISHITTQGRIVNIKSLIACTQIKFSLHTDSTEGSNSFRRQIVLTIPLSTTIDVTILNGLATGCCPTTEVTDVTTTISLNLTQLTAGREGGINEFCFIAVNSGCYLIVISLAWYEVEDLVISILVVNLYRSSFGKVCIGAPCYILSSSILVTCPEDSSRFGRITTYGRSYIVLLHLRSILPCVGNLCHILSYTDVLNIELLSKCTTLYRVKTPLSPVIVFGIVLN